MPEEGFFPALGYLLANVGQTNPWTAALGLGGLAALLLLSRLAPRAPAAIIVVGAGILITAALGAERPGRRHGRRHPPWPTRAGAPRRLLAGPAGPGPAGDRAGHPGLRRSASVAQDLATRHGYDVDPDRELIALDAPAGWPV